MAESHETIGETYLITFQTDSEEAAARIGALAAALQQLDEQVAKSLGAWAALRAELQLNLPAPPNAATFLQPVQAAIAATTTQFNQLVTHIAQTPINISVGSVAPVSQQMLQAAQVAAQGIPVSPVATAQAVAQAGPTAAPTAMTSAAVQAVQTVVQSAATAAGEPVAQMVAAAAQAARDAAAITHVPELRQSASGRWHHVASGRFASQAEVEAYLAHTEAQAREQARRELEERIRREELEREQAVRERAIARRQLEIRAAAAGIALPGVGEPGSREEVLIPGVLRPAQAEAMARALRQEYGPIMAAEQAQAEAEAARVAARQAERVQRLREEQQELVRLVQARREAREQMAREGRFAPDDPLANLFRPDTPYRPGRVLSIGDVPPIDLYARLDIPRPAPPPPPEILQDAPYFQRLMNGIPVLERFKLLSTETGQAIGEVTKAYNEQGELLETVTRRVLDQGTASERVVVEHQRTAAAVDRASSAFARHVVWITQAILFYKTLEAATGFVQDWLATHIALERELVRFGEILSATGAKAEGYIAQLRAVSEATMQPMPEVAAALTTAIRAERGLTPEATAYAEIAGQVSFLTGIPMQEAERQLIALERQLREEHISLAEAMDIAAQATIRGTGNFEEYIRVIDQFVPLGRELGMTFEQVARMISLGTLATGELPERVVQALRQSERIYRAPEAQQALFGAGIPVFQRTPTGELERRPFIDILNDVIALNEQGKITRATYEGLLAELSGARSLQGRLMLEEIATFFATHRTEWERPINITFKTMFVDQRGTTYGSIEELHAAWSRFTAALGGSTPVRESVRFLSGALDALASGMFNLWPYAYMPPSTAQADQWLDIESSRMQRTATLRAAGAPGTPTAGPPAQVAPTLVLPTGYATLDLRQVDMNAFLARYRELEARATEGLPLIDQSGRVIGTAYAPHEDTRAMLVLHKEGYSAITLNQRIANEALRDIAENTRAARIPAPTRVVDARLVGRDEVNRLESLSLISTEELRQAFYAANIAVGKERNEIDREWMDIIQSTATWVRDADGLALKLGIDLDNALTRAQQRAEEMFHPTVREARLGDRPMNQEFLFGQFMPRVQQWERFFESNGVFYRQMEQAFLVWTAQGVQLVRIRASNEAIQKATEEMNERQKRFVEGMFNLPEVPGGLMVPLSSVTAGRIGVGQNGRIDWPLDALQPGAVQAPIGPGTPLPTLMLGPYPPGSAEEYYAERDAPFINGVGSFGLHVNAFGDYVRNFGQLTGSGELAPQLSEREQRLRQEYAFAARASHGYQPNFPTYAEWQAQINAGQVVWPTPGHERISLGYGQPYPAYMAQYGLSGLHTGIDISAPLGAEVVAAVGGRVMSPKAGGYGTNVVILGDDGNLYIYGHLSQRVVQIGQQVAAGQQIGLVGSTGRATGPHLHFEVRQAETDRPIDPTPYLAQAVRDLGFPYTAPVATDQAQGKNLERLDESAREASTSTYAMSMTSLRAMLALHTLSENAAAAAGTLRSISSIRIPTDVGTPGSPGPGPAPGPGGDGGDGGDGSNEPRRPPGRGPVPFAQAGGWLTHIPGTGGRWFWGAEREHELIIPQSQLPLYAWTDRQPAPVQPQAPVQRDTGEAVLNVLNDILLSLQQGGGTTSPQDIRIYIDGRPAVVRRVEGLVGAGVQASGVIIGGVPGVVA